MSILTRIRQRIEAWLVGLLEPIIQQATRDLAASVRQDLATADARRLQDRGVLEAEFAAVRVVVTGLTRDVTDLQTFLHAMSRDLQQDRAQADIVGAKLEALGVQIDTRLTTLAKQVDRYAAQHNSQLADLVEAWPELLGKIDALGTSTATLESVERVHGGMEKLAARLVGVTGMEQLLREGAPPRLLTEGRRQ